MSGRYRPAAQKGFSGAQLELLGQDLDQSRVRHRQAPDGAEIAYVEGWFVLAEANAIFGYAGWEREIVHFERVFELRRVDETSCGYVARVKITVRAGQERLAREGTGFGQAIARNPGDAHELAIKAAETDATKRALATFGNRFGLGLYGKEANSANGNAQKTGSPSGQEGEASTKDFTLLTPEGGALAEKISAEAFCTGLRQMIANCGTTAMVEALEENNESQIVKVADLQLKSQRGTLYSDILRRLLKNRKDHLQSKPDVIVQEDALSVPQPANGVAMPTPDKDVAPTIAEVVQPDPPGQVVRRIDKSSLAVGVQRRVRDKEHLRAVAQMPCVICNRQPSHAHHLRFAQQRGLSQKVSDEYVVPLCALHHGDLHRTAREENWWSGQNLDPLPIALELWTRHLALQA
jgi:DNA recombination protein Rad52